MTQTNKQNGVSNHMVTRATGGFDERDSLTGVKGLYVLLNEADSYTGDDVYVTMCDVDNFRLINDALGDNAGNELLSRIGNIIMQNFGDDHTFRYGSDEFLIVNSFFDEDAFLAKIAALEKRFASIKLGETHLNLTCSFGYVHGGIHSAADLHEAIRYSDRKMYEAKRLGKARSVGSPLAVDPLLNSGTHKHASSHKTYETDELTGLANLIYFYGMLDRFLDSQEISDDVSDDSPTLIYFNIENFKAYNQYFGFDSGDRLLLLISNAIESAFPGDEAARFSADQFAVLTTREKAVPGIKSVRAAFRKKQKDSSIWLRAGFYTLHSDDDDSSLSCDRAKLACDAIKGHRDSFYREYDEQLKQQILQRRYVLDSFDRAIKEGWIRTFYQPIVRVATGKTCDVEALARWVDPERGIIPPCDFIPVLEEARLIHKLDLQILRNVCEDCLRVSNSSDSTFIAPSLNLSRLDFELCDIVAEVESVIDEYGIPYDRFSIEVTESSLTDNQEFLKSEIDRFRADGFEVWMDDFGSGYSSLNVLKDYRFDLVKIDMGFLRNFDNQEEVRILLAHIINMLKELGVKTLVEGVETQEQFDFLKSIGCGHAQGFFMGRPQSMDDSLLASKEGSYPPIEPHGSRTFYSTVGRMNLMRPDPHRSVDDHYLPSDTAAAIIERRDGKFQYLNISDLFRKMLEDSGYSSAENSELVLNNPSSPIREPIVSAIERCALSGKWERCEFEDSGRKRHFRIKLISAEEESDAIAVIFIAQERD